MPINLRRKFPTAAVLLAAMLLSTTAGAQPATKRRTLAELDAEVTLLKQQVAELAAQSPTLASGVQELTSQLTQVQVDLALVARQQVSVPEAIDKLDALTLRVDAMARDVEGLRTSVADLSQPSAGGGSTGGVGYSNGFRWSTDDNRFALRLAGFAQFRYQLVNTLSNGEIDESSINIRRARFEFAGHVGSDDVTFRLLTEMTVSAPLMDFTVNYRIDDAFQVLVGQYRTPFTREFITDSRNMYVTERSTATDAFRYDRSFGAAVHGTFLDDKFYYLVGASNGAGRNEVNDNIDFAAFARVEGAILGKRIDYSYGDLARSDDPLLTVGVGAVHDLTPVPETVGALPAGVGNRDVDADGDIDNVRVISTSADLLFRWHGFELAAEFLYRNEDWGAIFDHPDNFDLAQALSFDKSRNYIGYYGKASYVIPPKIFDRDLLFGARVGHSRLPLLGVDGQASAVPRADRLLDLDGVVQLYSHQGSRWIGLHFSYFDFNAKDGPDPENDVDMRLILETQLRW